VNHASWFMSRDGNYSLNVQFEKVGKTYALTRTTSFSSVISVYFPCSFSFICFTLSILNNLNIRVKGREMKGTLLSFEHLQTMLSHKRITVIFDLLFQFCKNGFIIFVFIFFEIPSRPIGIIRFYKSGSQRSDPRVAIGKD
jgi:hypothetical protein